MYTLNLFGFDKKLKRTQNTVQFVQEKIGVQELDIFTTINLLTKKVLLLCVETINKVRQHSRRH